VGWGRIDDAFDDHEKVLALLDLDEGIAAIGLWTLCFTWAHRNTRKRGKTPGLLPSTLPRRFVGARGKELAGLLVEAGMWDVVGDGWMIHDFSDYLPDKETSAARSEAGKKGAASRWGNRKTDGKLPSTDGKANGKPDGQNMARPDAGESDDASAAHEGGSTASDGKEPLKDGNLPSGSHQGDGKPVASDGSRAPARRATPYGVAPTPIPIPEITPPSAGAAAPAADDEATARTIIGEWIERCSKRPPSQVIGQIGKQIKALLAEGIAPDDIRRGMSEWMTRDVHPSVLPSIVNSVMNSTKNQKGNGSGSQVPERGKPRQNPFRSKRESA
jgi:hypothetical protein